LLLPEITRKLGAKVYWTLPARVPAHVSLVSKLPLFLIYERSSIRGGNGALVDRRGIIYRPAFGARECEGAADGRMMAYTIVTDGGDQPVTIVVRERWGGIFNTRWRHLAIA
jgi:hypothetical protein